MIVATAFWSETSLRFVLLGLATGSLTALVALGIVLVYRASGVLNFAAGALGGLAAFVCYELREAGTPGWAAATAGILIGAALGVVTFLALALLRDASLLTKLIATLGIFSAAQATMALIWGEAVSQPEAMFPTDDVTLWGELRIGTDRLALIAISLALALALKLVYTRTLFGLATSAVAENRRVAASAGWSPAVVEVVNFAVAGALSALAAVLLAPVVGLNGAVLASSVLPALAAALVGRFSSFGITVGAALLIGVLQSEFSLFQADLADLFGMSAPSLSGVSASVPLVVILAVLLATGRSRLQRGEIAARLPLPGTGEVSLLKLGTAVVVVGLLIAFVDSWTDALITTFALGIVLCSLVVLCGYAGQLSLCQFAFAGLGGWIAARLISANGYDLIPALLLAVLGTALIGALVALPAIRARGTELAIATLAMALMFNAVVFGNAAVNGGFIGLPIEGLALGPIELDPINDAKAYAAVVFVFLVGVGLVVANLRRGDVGLRLLAVRGNERAAAALGINVVHVKLYAFSVSAAIAALGGVFLCLQRPNVQFGDFGVVRSVSLVQYAVLGGVGWVAGAAQGAIGAPGGVINTIGNGIFAGVDDFAGWLVVVFGVGLVLTLRQAPDGVAPHQARLMNAVFDRIRPPRARPELEPRSRPTRAPGTLDVSGVSVRFGAVDALADVSFSVRPGEIVGLIGPNGAGKTTLIDVVTGFTPPTTGSVNLDGRTIDSWSVEQRARGGIGRSWQAVELFEEMTVRENLIVAVDDQSWVPYLTNLVRPGRRRPTAVLNGVVEEFALGGVLDYRPSSLSHGTARLVGIARAIVGEPSVLLLDEPAAGLDPNESAELAVAIRAVARDRGIGVLVIEHDVPLLMELCDRIIVLDFGRKIAEGAPADVASDTAVIAAYLGSDNTAVHRPSNEMVP